MATNKNITMRQYNGVDYDTLYPKTIASQIDDVYSKSETSNLFLPKAGGSMGGILDMNGNRITNLPTPASNSDPATKEYVDEKSGNLLAGVTKITTFTDTSFKEISFNFEGLQQLIFIVNGSMSVSRDYRGIAFYNSDMDTTGEIKFFDYSDTAASTSFICSNLVLTYFVISSDMSGIKYFTALNNTYNENRIGGYNSTMATKASARLNNFSGTIDMYAKYYNP